MATRTSTKLFYKYYRNWIDLYKKGAVRHATLIKYELAYKHVRRLCPDLHMNQIDRKSLRYKDVSTVNGSYTEHLWVKAIQVLRARPTKIIMES